jgi:MSHA biogenesis protein MshL
VLHIHPIVSEVQDQTKTFIVGNQTQTLPLALSNVRESDSIVRARSGQVVVIGGLMEQRNRDEDFGLPVLSSIPLIGNLFKQQRKSQRKSELVILLRPLAVGVDTPASWDPKDHLSPPPAPMKIP